MVPQSCFANTKSLLNVFFDPIEKIDIVLFIYYFSDRNVFLIQNSSICYWGLTGLFFYWGGDVEEKMNVHPENYSMRNGLKSTSPSPLLLKGKFLQVLLPDHHQMILYFPDKKRNSLYSKWMVHSFLKPISSMNWPISLFENLPVDAALAAVQQAKRWICSSIG